MPPITHIASIQTKGGAKTLYLRRVDAYRFIWYRDDAETDVTGGDPAEAILAARKEWAQDHFRTIHCGYRYSLPERDEHGTNALFSEMVASYSSMNGVYFDPELGYNCFVQNASQEALTILKSVTQTAKL